MKDSTSRRTTRARTLIALGIGLAVLGGGTTWLLLGRENAVPCNGLPGNERVRTSLGAAVQPDMSCAAFGEAVMRTTVGERPGVHTEAQARALKDVLVALDSWESKSVDLDPALRAPLATALADYAPDLHAMLGGNDADYITKAGPNTPPWESEGTHHIAVFPSTLTKVLRAIAEDPDAYAVLRMAETRSAAQRLAAVPAQASGHALTVPPTESARALGTLDGVADLVTRSRNDEQARAWRATVVDELLREPAATGGLDDGAAADLIEAWLNALKATPESRRAERLSTQAVDLARAWAEGRKADSAATGELLEKVQKSHSTARQEVTAP
ncbi:hypothetical protein [Streptomyces sp. NPDC126499]|uniref:hypothetical protein n=1 Tax=Streptomyces sp. NPDC126499 TaxID=3155314 RepID=UPI00332D88DC